MRVRLENVTPLSTTVTVDSKQPPLVAAYHDWDLLTRTSWVSADLACHQIEKGKATGNVPALKLRGWLQMHLFNLGCIIQTNSGTVLFLGLLLLSLSCIGLKNATIETDIEKLWVEEGGRLAKELAYTAKILGEESGTTNEIIIQMPKSGGNVLSVESMLAHFYVVKSIVRISIDLFNTKWTFRDLCYATSFPSFDDGALLDQILSNLAPCVIVTPLDCFWEGSKILGPDFGIYVPGFLPGVKWSNLNPQDILDMIENYPQHYPQLGQIKNLMNRAGITTGYMSKACLNPADPECPVSSPNYSSKQHPDIAAELTKGCTGFATKLMKWEEDLIIGGVKRNKSGHILRAEALQTIVQLMGAKDLYEFHRDTNKMLRIDWTLEKAKQVLDTWQRQFTIEVERSANLSNSENIHSFSSVSLMDMLKDFSEFSTVKVILGYLFMLIYACISLIKWNNSVRSQGAVGIAGVLIVALSMAAGLGISSIAGIKFNASTTQIIPFLALGMGMDNMFQITNIFSEHASKQSIPFMEQTGKCLKRIGPSILLTSLTRFAAFSVAAIIPIPALRAFCLQCAILVVFNVSSMLFVFLSVISLDLRRQRDRKIDLFCCFQAINLPQMSNVTTLESSPLSSSSINREINAVDAISAGQNESPWIRESDDVIDDRRQSIVSIIESDKSKPTALLSHFPTFDRRVVRNAVCPTFGQLSTLSASHNFPELSGNGQVCGRTPSPSAASSHFPVDWNGSGCCQDCLLQTCRCWSLTRFARYTYAPFLGRMSTKVTVVVTFLSLFGAGIVGTTKMRNGLEITDVIPRGTSEHKFLEARSKYFGFYNFFAVTKNNFDYHSTAGQRLLTEYYRAFNGVDAIIRKEDGNLPDFWLNSFRNWLIDKQNAYDRDWKAGSLHKDGWFKNVSSDGMLGYKLMIQTGDLDEPINKHRTDGARLVDGNGIIYSNAFYNYLTAWTSNDAMAYGMSQASLHPIPKEWFHDIADQELRIPKSQSLIYAQLAFHLHHLNDTKTITSTITEIRGICERFEEKGLPNYPQGIPFTFWEQYLHLIFYLLITLVSLFGIIFVILTIFLLNVWIAFITVFVLSTIAVELSGVMGFLGVQMNAIPAVIMIISIGISVEFIVHVSFNFLTSIGCRTRRAQMALQQVFAPLMHSAVTTILAVVMLLGTDFDFIFRYFFIELLAVVLISLANGLLLFPVLLSIVGPKAEVVPNNNTDYLPPPSPSPESTKTSRKTTTKQRKQRVRMPCNISLTTITEEPSHLSSSSSSSSDSKISLHLHPEVVVKTTLPCGGATTTTTFINNNRNNDLSVQHDNRPITTLQSMQSTSNSGLGHHVTTVKALAKVKVEVHRLGSGLENKLLKAPTEAKERQELPELCSNSFTAPYNINCN